MAKFDHKTFNEEAFGKYVDVIPKTKRNELLKSKALRPNSQIRQAFEGQTGVVYATLPMYGRIGGKPLNYDGETDITSESTTTFDRSVIVVGRAKAWTEKDFSEDITGGADFMGNVASQVSEYWEDVDQDTLLSILKGIFAMTGNSGNTEFVDKHTYDTNKLVDSVTLNNATQKASGDNKNKFSLVIMHSQVATTLENMKVLDYLTYTDSEGIERKLQLATWNGKAVLIDDSMPTEEVAAKYVKAKSTDEGALKVVANSATPEAGEVKIETTAISVEAGDYVVYLDDHVKYTSYALGDGAFDFENIGVEMPFEMDRNPKQNGGQTTLYSRQRKVFAPYGISFTKKNMVKNSPTTAELEKGTNWELVHNGVSSSKEYIDHKAIPIVQIKSLG